MKDDDTLPTTTAANVKKESSDSSLFGKGRYKFWALAAVLLLAFWSMFTGTVTLRWSAGNLNRLSDDLDSPIHDDLDVLEMEEREKVVKHMWDVYTNGRRIRLPRFWQEAFEAAYEELTSDVPGVREAAITEIAKMSVRSVDLDPLPIQSANVRELSKGLKRAEKSGSKSKQNNRRCPYCSASQGRCATTTTGRSITECTSCGRVVEERQFQNHHLFHVRAQDTPVCLVTSDIPTPASAFQVHEDDPFEPTGFITAFSTWSLEPTPLFLRSSFCFSGHLAELERTLELSSSSTPSPTSSSTVVVDNLRAYMQIIDVASILGLDSDISDHAFQLFRDCCSATCLRNRSVEALATAALVQAIREAQEPRTLQELSIAANVPQKEIGKYIKILGEALQLSQPINSNSISVHMPRFCTLLQLNKSAQELATHIGEVVISKCFCTRRNPISISAAAIYLACQLEDKRKTQAEICKVTGLIEVTLRKVYKELLENWEDLLPSKFTPAVPLEKAFPTTAIGTGRSSVPRVDPPIDMTSSLDGDRQQDSKLNKPNETAESGLQASGKVDAESNGNSSGAHLAVLNQPIQFRQPWLQFGPLGIRTPGDNNQTTIRGDMNEAQPSCPELEQKGDKPKIDTKGTASSLRPSQFSAAPTSNVSTVTWQFRSPSSAGTSPNMPIVHPPKLPPGYAELKGHGNQNGSKNPNQSGES